MRRYNYILLAIVIFFLAGCVEPGVKKVGEQTEVLDVKPIVDYNFLGGYTGDAREAFFVVAGDTDIAKQNAKALIVGEAEQTAQFSVDEPLNFVIFRGVFSTGGYGLEIEGVEKRGNTISVRAVYRDPAPESIVTQAFTQPTAVIPIGPLEAGNYNVKMFVTVILKSESGDKVLEKGNEHASVEFKVG